MGPKVSQPLPLSQVAAALDLELALADVVDGAVAGHVVERLLFARRSARAVPMTTPSSTSQSLLTELLGSITGSFGPWMQLVGLHEDHRARRDRQAGLGRVVGIVEADGDELADAWPPGCRSAACP